MLFLCNTYALSIFSLMSEYASCCQQEHLGSKTVLQQSSSFLSGTCRLTNIDMYNGCKQLLLLGCVVSLRRKWPVGSDSG